jgi:UDP-N-acetylmuramate-alanine ligase
MMSAQQTCILTANWYDRPNEPTGWHVEVIRADEQGDRYVVTDSEKVTFPVEVDRFGRHQRADLAAALLVAFPGAEIRGELSPAERCDKACAAGPDAPADLWEVGD